MEVDESSNTNSLFNNINRYDWVSIILHWALATVLMALYFVGDYMVELDYYDTWYYRAPQIYKEVGVVIGALMVFRLLWNTLQISPQCIGNSRAVVKVM